MSFCDTIYFTGNEERVNQILITHVFELRIVNLLVSANFWVIFTHFHKRLYSCQTATPREAEQYNVTWYFRRQPLALVSDH